MDLFWIQEWVKIGHFSSVYEFLLYLKKIRIPLLDTIENTAIFFKKYNAV